MAVLELDDMGNDFRGCVAAYPADMPKVRLRELHDENPERVQREYRKGKHGETMAWYRYVPSPYEVLNAKMRPHSQHRERIPRMVVVHHG
jgi:hypothetical protein